MFFSFPQEARWNAERRAVGVEIGEYRGVVRVPRHVFQNGCYRSGLPPRSAWKPTIYNRPGSRASPSGNLGDGT
jgi:hypothetical protein